MKGYERKKKLLSVVLSLVLSFQCFFVNVQSAEASGAQSGESAVFQTDVIYQIVTDRFMDGNPNNNPSGGLYDYNSWGSGNRNNRLYHGGDWQGIINKIDDGYFDGMGVTALWISSPVENNDFLDPADWSVEWTGTSYHGYWGKDFFRTNPYFGSMSDFRTLISKAHSHGIKIVIDFAPNHTSTTTDFANPVDWTKYPSDGALYRDGSYVGNMHSDAYNNFFNHEGWVNDWDSLEEVQYHSMYGLADLNQMNPVIDDYMKDAIDMWLDMGVDGIRVDAVKHMSFGWQKNWISDIYEEHPVFIFGEWFSGGTSPDADMSHFANESGMSLLDFNFANAVRNSVGSLSGSMRDLHNSILATADSFEQVNNQVTFIDNHDMSRFMTLSNNTSSSVDTAFVIQLTERGVPAIYYGTEQYLTGDSDPENRKDMPCFDTNSNAYKIISRLSALRKNNPAIGYGTYRERWLNDDVYVYERQFGSSVVLVAVNRNTSTGYNLTNLYTNLPQGTYQDVLCGLKGGWPVTVNAGGCVPDYYLGAGVCAVWEYTASTESNPIIGSVDPFEGITGNEVTITGRGFGSKTGTVKFNDTQAQIVKWSDDSITVKVPNVAAGKYTVYVKTKNGKTSSGYANFKVLSGHQTAVRFKVNASTYMGQNVYIVGSVYELGNWSVTRDAGPFYNRTQSISQYPYWFFDVSVPANSRFEYKFVKVDGSGNIEWESGWNHIITTSDAAMEVNIDWQNY